MEGLSSARPVSARSVHLVTCTAKPHTLCPVSRAADFISTFHCTALVFRRKRKSLHLVLPDLLQRNLRLDLSFFCHGRTDSRPPAPFTGDAETLRFLGQTAWHSCQPGTPASLAPGCSCSSCKVTPHRAAMLGAAEVAACSLRSRDTACCHPMYQYKHSAPCKGSGA